jgi:phosphate transport system protein
MMFSEMEEMLGDGVGMFRPVSEVLRGKRSLTTETHNSVYETDRRINHLQRKIRKQLVEHLIVSPGTDVPISLVLMSITKDAERVGDICKNLLEVAEAMGGPLGNDALGARLTELLSRVEELFSPTVAAFRESDKEVGRDTVERSRAIAKECDGVIDTLMEAELPCRTAVLYTLTARYLKRMSLHLSNIASSVVMPLHRLDYYDEKWDDLAKRENGDDG